MNRKNFIILATVLNTMMFGALTVITLFQYMTRTEAALSFIIILIASSYLSYFTIHR